MIAGAEKRNGSAADSRDHAIEAIQRTTPPPSPWLNRKEAAAFLGVCEKTVSRMVRDRQLRCARIGGRRACRFKVEFLNEALDRYMSPIEEP